MAGGAVAIMEMYLRNLDQYTIEQLRSNSTEKAWSIGQVYTHVIDVANEYMGYVASCAADIREVREGKTEAGEEAFANLVWPDVRVKLEEPADATPNPSDKAELVAGLKGVLEKLHAWEDRLDSINPAYRRQHGWFGWLNAREWFEMVGMHGKHHLRQIARLEQLLVEQSSAIYWTEIPFKNRTLITAATDRGLCFIGSHESALHRWKQRWAPEMVLIRDDAACSTYVEQLVSYLAGQETSFTFSVDLRGTDFQLVVWEALRSIPYGQTVSYSDIASLIGRPSSVRAVGTAIGSNPLLIVIPCHRVIAKNGSLSGYRDGLEMKAGLLELEAANVKHVGT